ncbi:MAG: sugar phosphate nucleotidyltransferase [Candidatus Nanoarchaeia archaeon]|nr:sugar phosphate nucleotidyltransferase [Candidatus Nanoarchaeia archaeon]
MINREHISLTLDKNILSEVDKLIDGNNIRNRSHAIEVLLSRVIDTKKVKKAFILAGGKGTRLRPITYEIPKPMVLIHGKPLLQHTIELLKKYDITDIILSIGYMGDKIKEYFGNGSKFGVKITYVEESEPSGTAGALRLAKLLLDNCNFIMINGDNLYNIDYAELIQHSLTNAAVATIALTTVADPSKFGVAKMKGNKIVDFVEKPTIENAPSKLINAGIYVFTSKIFDYIPEKHFSMIETEVFPKLIKNEQFYGYIMEGQWLPAGTLEEYEQAIKEWKDL